MAEKTGLIFTGFQVSTVLFQKGDNTIKNDGFSVKIEHLSEFKDKESKQFKCIFIVEVEGTEDKSIKVNLQAEGDFELHGELPESVIENYIQHSSPSIVYPYIRAFITNLTIQSGMKTGIIIPPMNFSGIPVDNEK